MRLVIGIVSGCFLQLLIETGALKILIGNFDISKDSAAGWRSVVAVGFIAGFIERLVPSLLQEGLPLPRGPKSREEANDTGKAVTRRRASRKGTGGAVDSPVQ